MLRIFIGYDSREPVAYHVCAHSILSRASGPVAIIPLVQPALRAAGLYTRERGKTESTEFSMTRFLVPYLADYEGDAIFMDSDMLCLADIYEVMDVVERDRRTRVEERRNQASRGLRSNAAEPAVYVCQHDYASTATVKFLNQINVPYPRKNWSSFMVFDCVRCKALTPARVNILSGLELHRFSWLDDGRVGALPLEWNWLVGEYVPNPKAKILHYTLGGPWFESYRNCDHAREWFDEWLHMSPPGAELMTAHGEIVRAIGTPESNIDAQLAYPGPRVQG